MFDNDMILEISSLHCDYENLNKYFPFSSKRYGQSEILEALQKYLLDPNIKYILLEASTGVGKSAMAITTALASKSAYICTANKFLQNQYLRDFSDTIVDLKGRANYKCYMHEVPEALKEKIGEFYNCSNSPCQRTPDNRKTCAKHKRCEYHTQLDNASKANITSFNFASALSFLNYLKKYFNKREILICDECHNIPHYMTNFISIDFSVSDLKRLGLKKNIPDYEDISQYSDYLTDIQIAVKRLLKSPEGLESHIVAKLDTLLRKFKLFDTITDNKCEMDNIIAEKSYDINDKKLIEKISFKPVVVSELVDTYLFSHASKVLLMSATILDFPTYMEIMGIDKSKCAIIRVPSFFPAYNRPIYTRYAVGYLNQKNINELLPKLSATVKHLLEMYPKSKGLIHGITYKICDYLYENIKSDRILYAKTAHDQKSIIDEHTSSDKPTMILSPSMTEGVDLYGEYSRLQIIVKMPYPYLGDPVLKKRMAIYHNYYNMLTALTLTQAYGRSIRSEDDHCHTYILDLCFVPFIERHRSIIPDSFLEAIYQ